MSLLYVPPPRATNRRTILHRAAAPALCARGEVGGRNPILQLIVLPGMYREVGERWMGEGTAATRKKVSLFHPNSREEGCSGKFCNAYFIHLERGLLDSNSQIQAVMAQGMHAPKVRLEN